ncbi:ATPase [Thiomicrorhabdus immobilis]|uniref:ATPase n=1 Tax=Thiomicrorhabdus immobilis TaxID=2791037 RepID=A0ABM7MBQ7_9GAMM|nr:AAA family ATPase [Thiomicrorhabdus immobilis]BCN92772.1 ATPase [Thiomicrorhabdus immobilis]
MIHDEYFRFLKNLEGSEEDIIKVANLVSDNLDELAGLSTRNGQRAKRFVELAQNSWDALSTELIVEGEDETDAESAIEMLSELTVGPFRGFAKPEKFDLSSKIVLIYGPNGTGKSSFCEALEFGLLGSVSEAENNRFRNPEDYLKNAHENQFTPPILKAKNSEGTEIAISPSTNFRFCFVEKNRIDSFSRIAAQAPAKQTELISTLFGLEAFTEFVRNFTTELDDRYIDLVGIKSTQLQQKRQKLAGSVQQIQQGKQDLIQIEKESQALVTQYRQGLNFDQMVAEIYGNDDSGGKIKTLEAELQQSIPGKNNLTKISLETLGSEIAGTVSKLEQKQQELVNSSQQVSFQQLYEAVTQLKSTNHNECPACKTPVEQVRVNPFNHATEELVKLQQLAATQQAIQGFSSILQGQLSQLYQIVNICLRQYPESNPLKTIELAPDQQPAQEWWDRVITTLADGFTPWHHLVSQLQQLEVKDQEIDALSQARTSKQSELDSLRKFERQIISLKTRKETFENSIKAASRVVESFEEENSELIAAVEAEKTTIAQNIEITKAYGEFVGMLNNYNDSLPLLLVANLSDSIVELYNAFNRNDTVSELLAEVKLPLAQNQRLEIAFQNEPGKYHDALHVLSEGHLRCIGLSVLLAKNLKEDAPLLIFDDPVNAIDDDHRENIRLTLFEDDYFKDKQIILTSHGEEFYKDIQNLLPREVANSSKKFDFLPRLDEVHIRVNMNSSPRHYILAARTHINAMERREALAKARQALEVLTKDKIWKYVHKHGDGSLSIKLRGAKAPLELRNLTEQLKSKINKGDFGDPNKDNILIPLTFLLGLNGDSREWRYLNKGTHEESDRAEFDRNTVDQIITYLEQIEAALNW